MLVAIQSQQSLHTTALPSEAEGARWIADNTGVVLAHAVGREGRWYLEPSEGLWVRGADGATRSTIEIEPAKLAVVNLDDREGRSWCLVFHPDCIDSIKTAVWGFAGERDLSIGRADDNDLVYPCTFVSGHHARLSYRAGRWSVVDLDSSNGVFLNGRRIGKGSAVTASFGDVVNVFGLRMTLGAGFIACNNPEGSLRVADRRLVRYQAVAPDRRSIARPVKRDFFYPALRFARAIEKKSFVIDAPPQPEREDETSLAMRIGPSLIMAFASIMSAAVFVTMMSEQGSSMLRAVPMIAMAVAMLAGSVLWPVLNSRHERKRRARNEARRRAAYSQYVNKVRSELAAEASLQQEILVENRISVQLCLDRAFARDPRVMDRTSLHADFLDVRLGVGDEPFEVDIRFPDQRFSLEEDDLREAVDALANEPRILHRVPLALSLVDTNIVGVVGARQEVHAFARGLAVQVAALCSYEDVKLIVLCDEEDRSEWEFALHLPHCFSDDRSMRYFACGLEEASELGLFMERVLDARRGSSRFEARDAAPYYVVVCASDSLADRADAVRAIVRDRVNWGVSLIALADEMKDLPKECRSVVSLEGGAGYLLRRDDPSGNRRFFAPDIAVSCEDAQRFACALGRVKLDLATEARKIPARLGFLELFDVANVDHLNIAARWRDGNASSTLACRVGVDASGEPFLLNLHEKFHGPHGLIAGTTGSGKSEFIITYILSMAMTYSPNEVAFVLIDYKGGGLAKAFDNEHVRLPHLAGVITNLDGAAITRSLVSINSELKRRQALFNRARDVVGGDNVDIYGYLDLFRQGKMDEPCPHLFIVADEFAELKQQEPEFMDELISAARIGRSLGVHLILATQKPSGVVNDQIWSNARFKVCLKVADAADSMEMIKRPDAAELVEAGRFYLLVGYNEYFALGQAAYAGTRYVPRERFEREKDDAVVLISDTGRPLVSVKPRRASSFGEDRPESVAMLDRIERTAESLHVRARQLWLEPLPALLVVDELARKYGVETQSSATGQGRFVLEPIIGELDDPQSQRQALLALPLTKGGSALLYGTPESGVEAVLCSLLYSLLRSHDADSLNAYVLDFGSESLRAFDAAPQVGDVICAGDDEKAKRFFDFVEAEVARRRTVLAPYGGSFLRYADAVGAMPSLLVILNDVAAFMELYPNMEERLAKLTREAGRSGIHLVMTAASTGSVRLRMRSTFRQVLACDPADPGEYGMIFGSMKDVPVPHGFARGLVRTDDGVLEFQGAQVCRDGDAFGFVSAFCHDLAAKAEEEEAAFAKPIPTVPERVVFALLPSDAGTALRVPFGLYHDTLAPACLDLEERAMGRILYARRKDGASFVSALLDSMKRRGGLRIAVFDFDDQLRLAGKGGSAKEFIEMLKALMLDDMLGAPETEGPVVLFVSGFAGFCSSNPLDDTTLAKDYLAKLDEKGNVRVVLFDQSDRATYQHEPWFRAQFPSREGVWVGSGADSQSAINISYAPGVRIAGGLSKKNGYEVRDGIPRLVALLEEE